MATITFFEKTGCINNTKQKQLLTMAGHKIQAVDIITHKWEASELLEFFDKLPVKEWFNSNAPRITSGELNPEIFNEETAIEAMLTDHLLIRRPLLLIGNEKVVGFDKELLDTKIGLSTAQKPVFERLMKENLDDCPQKSKGTSC